ncbi:9227_t:CDS:2, partial [Ambispora gerdemannii]
LRYDGAGPLTGIPSRNDIVAEFDNGMTVILQQSLSGKQPIHFMPTEVSDDTSEYVNGISSYILRITGTLINGQKAVVKITGIKPFFDVEVPEEMPLSTFKTRLVNILSNTLKGTSKFGIENISAFPLRGYHTEKRAYIRITTWNHFDRYNALKAIRGVDNLCTLHQIIEDVLEETVKDISQTDLNEIIKTAVWRPDKNNKSVQRFISRMRDRHTREEADTKRLIKKGLTPKPYLYEIPEPGERFEYVVVENDLSQKVGDKMEYPEVARCLGKKIDISYYLKSVIGLCARFINYDDSYQPSSETLLEALKKLKDGNKAGDNKADDAQKSAEKWVRGYIKNLHEGPKKDEAIISHLWKGARIYAKKLFDTTYANKIEKHSGYNAYYTSFLNALDKQEESIRLKLSSLLKEISEVDIGYRESMYKLVTKKRAMSLEQYLTSYYLDECKLLADFRNIWFKVVGLEITRYRTLSKLQNSKKDDSSEADIDEIIELYG